MPDPAGGIDPAGLIATLFQAEAARLTSLARFFVDDRTAAEDLVQEAFIRLSRSLDRIRDAERATAYLRSIVINLARDHNRRGLMSFRHRPPAQPDEPSAEATAADLERVVPRSSPSCDGCPCGSVTASSFATTSTWESTRSPPLCRSRATR